MALACLSCGAQQMMAAVTMTTMVPMADRNGTLKLGGVKVGQIDLKNVWDMQNEKERKIRGPIFCNECGEEHYYVVGGKPNALRRGSYDEAVAKGYESLLGG